MAKCCIGLILCALLAGCDQPMPPKTTARPAPVASPRVTSPKVVAKADLAPPEQLQPVQKPKEDIAVANKGEGRQREELQRKFDLLPGNIQQEIRILRKAIKSDGLEPTVEAHQEFIDKYQEFFGEEGVPEYLLKTALAQADVCSAADIMKVMGTDKRKDVLRLKLRYVKQKETNRLAGRELLRIAKQIKADGVGKLSEDDKVIVREYEWFLFPPAED